METEMMNRRGFEREEKGRGWMKRGNEKEWKGKN
jgi:hypothetical protein